MHLVDSGVWVALSIEVHEFHHAATTWLSTVMDPASVRFCRATQQSFLRLITTAAVFSRYGLQPLTNDRAWSTYETLLADDRIVFQEREPWGLDSRWKEFTARGTASPKLWMDAYMAAFARASGYRLVTTDAAFAQFDGLDLVLLGSSTN
ncbi:type II toxin-antitoxin system VapC family toxin [soil metagenome]